MNSIRQAGMVHRRRLTIHMNRLMVHECRSGVYYYADYVICNLLGTVNVTDHVSLQSTNIVPCV